MNFSISQDVEALNAQVKKVFGDLAEKGLIICSGAIKNTSAIGDYAEVPILNQATGVRLLIVYAPATNIRPESVSVFLENRVGDTFSLSDYLAHKQVDIAVRKSISLASHEGAIEDRLTGVLKAAKAIIFQNLDGCIFGDEWISIPIQWGDMK